jgi:indolepyruvate ferredoxin oxidoreductase beta subunit
MAILAMGGEGGGVLADWVVKVAEMNDYYAQNTSVAGVAQRTGATVYYVEMLPKPNVGDPIQEPILSTMPTPGQVDIVVASELMESGRAIQRGFCTPERTTLIASTNRVYSMPERTAMGDGRIESQEIIDPGTMRGGYSHGGQGH